MRLVSQPSDTPLDLVNALQANRKGLYLLELEQKHGPNGYRRTRLRWELDAKDGGEIGEDDEPHDDVNDIAEAVYAEAQAYRRRHGGETQFRLSLYRAGHEKPATVVFKVDDSPSALDEVESRARADFVVSITEYVDQLHRSDIRRAQVALRGVEDVLKMVLDLVPAVIASKIDAIEDRAEALLAGAQKRTGPSPEMKEARKAFSDFIKSPLAQAMGAKMLGLDVSEFMKLMGAAQTPAPEGSIREDLQAFGASLRPDQQLTMASTVGAQCMTKLLEAAGAPNDGRAIELIKEALEGVDVSKLLGLLDDEQKGLLDKLTTRIFGDS